MDPETRDELDQTIAAIAAQTGAVLHTYPRPGRAVRRVVLRDTRDDRGTQFEAAQLEDDGTLRVVGYDTGPGVSAVFGAAITSYEWVYVVPSGRLGALAQALGAEPGRCRPRRNGHGPRASPSVPARHRCPSRR